MLQLISGFLHALTEAAMSPAVRPVSPVVAEEAPSKTSGPRRGKSKSNAKSEHSVEAQKVIEKVLVQSSKSKSRPVSELVSSFSRIGVLLRRLARRGGGTASVTFRSEELCFEQGETVFRVFNLPISGEGAGMIPLRDLLPVLKLLPSDTSAILAGETVVFDSEGLSRTVRLESVTSDKPFVWEGRWSEVVGLGPFLARAVPFTDQSGSRYALNSMLLEDKGELVATNGKYLAVFHTPVRLPLASLRIPACPFFQAREIESLESVSVSRQQIAVKGANWLLSLPEESRPFPNWRDVMPKVANVCTHVTPDLLAALRSECLARKEHVLLECDGSILRLSSKDFSAVELPCPSERPWKIQLDPKLLTVVLREPVRQLKYFSSEQPLLCMGEGFKIILMPVSLDRKGVCHE